jgi:hypothetical protein
MLEKSQIFAATNAGNLYALIGRVGIPRHILSILRETQIALKVMLRGKPNPALKRDAAKARRPLAQRWAL